jgi:hypothetical protein
MVNVYRAATISSINTLVVADKYFDVSNIRIPNGFWISKNLNNKKVIHQTYIVIDTEQNNMATATISSNVYSPGSSIVWFEI